MPLFDPAIFDPAIFDTGGSGGASTSGTLFDEVMAAIEAEADGSPWTAGSWEPGGWDYCEFFNEVLKRLMET